MYTSIVNKLRVRYNYLSDEPFWENR